MSEGTQSSDNQTLDTDSGEPSTEAVQGEKTAEQGASLGWTFEDKNPFSAFSEEHLNKLDEVLQSDEVKELLQQSTSDLDLLNMDLGENGNQTSTAGVDADPITDELPESIMSAVFSDHGYCLNPGAQKAKTPGDNTPKAKPIMVSLDEEGNISPSIDIAASLLSPAVTRVIAKKESPYVNSPRKSGRAPTRNRMFDEEWVTESPGRSRGRGKTDQGSSPGFGKRASTRISDQKQRDLAEKILQANRQAMEAEKQADPLLGKGRGRGRNDADEVPSPGQGKKDEEEEEGEEEEKEEERNNEEEEKDADEEEEKSPKKSPKKKVLVNKRSKRYENDSDFSDDEKKETSKQKKVVNKKGQKEEEGDEDEDSVEEEKNAKKKKGRKGKKGQKDEEIEESEDEKKDATKKKKAVTKKGQKVEEGEENEDSEEESNDTKKKKGVKGKKGQKGEESEESGEDEKDAKKKKGKKSKKGQKQQKEGEESEESDEEEKNATKKKGKKGKLALKTKKKVKLKGKKLKREKKQADSEEDNSDKEKTEDESVPLPSKTKGLKKLSKKERLKKLKEAKEAKKAKLLAKKKAKSAKLKKKGKDTDAESTDTGTSPMKKKLRGKELTDGSDMSPSPTKKKVKGKETLDSPDVNSSPGKKKLKGKEEMGKKKKGVSDDEKSPVKKKAKLGAASDAESPGKKKGLSPKGNKKGQNESKSPVPAGKRKEADDSLKSDSPLKKQKLGKKGKKQVKSKREVSDSEDDTPLKKVKSSLMSDAKKSSQLDGINKPADLNTSIKKQNSDLNIFSAFSESVQSIGIAAKTDEGKDSKSNKSGSSIKDDLNDKKSKSQSTIKESKELNTQSVGDKTENKSYKVSGVVKPKGISVSKESESTNKTDKVLDKRKNVVDKEEGGEKRPDKPSEGKESHKRHDSNDSKDSKDGKHSHHHHHHHHHHRHHSSSSSSSRRHSHDRRESDDTRKDSTSSGSSHRKESTERRHSHDKKDGHDRKGSSKDRRDSSSSSSKDRKDRDRHDSRTDRDRSGSKGSAKLEKKDSTSSLTTPGKNHSGFDKNKLGSSGKKIGKDGKKVKKLKKEDPMDQSMVDLFKPDNMPDEPKEEKAVEKVEVEKVVVAEKSMRVRFSDEVDIRIDDKQESKDTSVFDDEVDVIKLEQTDPVKEMNEFEIKDNAHKADDDVEEVDNKDIKMENKEKVSVEQKLEEVKSDDVEVDSGKADHVTTNKTDQTENKSDIVADVTANKIEQTENKSDSIETEKSKSVDVSETALTKDDQTAVVIDVLHVKDKSNTAESEIVKTDESLVKDKSEEVKVVSEEPDIPDNNKTANDSEDIEGDHGNKVSNNVSNSVSNNDTKDEVESKPGKQHAIPAEMTSPKVRKTFQISDFFKEKRLKINDPKPRKPKVIAVAVPVATASPDTPTRQSARRNKGVAFAEIMKKEKLGSDEEEEEEEEEQQEPYKDDENDEDFEDPDQLYCICRQPHNQRFMICCDSCEEWFHGKCVGITRAQGEEMEKNEEEYVCPTCLNKDSQVSTTDTDQPKELSEDGTSVSDAVTSPDSTEGSVSNSYKPLMQDDKEISSTVKTPTKQKHAKHPTSDTKATAHQQRKKEPTLSEKRDRVIKMFKEGDSPKSDKIKITICVQCSVRPVKPGTKFCSGHCQTKYGVKEGGQKPAGILKVTHPKDKDMDKKNKEKHIAVVEKSTGKTFTGDKAPRESELKEWLENHPTFEVLKVHKKPTPTKQADEKSKSQHGKIVKSEEPDVRHEGPEPVRLNVRKGLRDALAGRANTADDIMLSNSEIKGLALGIEKELYHYFKDTDSKYKAKYRSLVFNIKDVKNKGLFRKILNGRIRPSKLVRMSADELASKELAQWREQETKHTIELIKQVETDLLKDPKQVTKKTHKGEVEVEGEGGVDMSTLVQEAKKEAPKVEEKADLLADLLPDTTDNHGHHLFDSNCKICTGKVVPGLSDTTSSSKLQTEITPKVKEEEKHLSKQEKDLQAEEVVKEVLKAIQRAKEEATRDERESKLGSAVTVRSPDSALSSGLDKKEKFTPSGPMLWKGFIYMQDVSKFVTSAYIITGPSDHLVLPDTITVCGRINPEHVWDYLSKVKQAASRDISVIRFIPGANEEKVAYINLYSYLNSRSRCGVVEHKAKHIKDFYVVPLASHSKIPSVLKPFDGPGLEENRCHMLIGVIIRNKGRSSSESSSSSSSHSSRHKKESSKPLKSALKDPTKKPSKKKAEIGEPVESAGNTPDKSSSSSTPKTSSSTSTPQEKKATTISFDPIVKEYSTVSEQDEPYMPGGIDDPLDPNAPYDPEKEAVLKTAVKKEKAKPDAVSIMIEKIALSKNPAEATAAMVTALATTSRLGNQRKLLVELTKKVDEQKRLLEQKRGGSKASKSPPASGSSPGQGTSSLDKSQKVDKKKGLSSKDPRLRAMAASAAKSKETAAEEAPVVTEAMDVDMRILPPHGGDAGTSVVPGGSDTSAVLSVPGTIGVPGGAATNVIPGGSAGSVVPGAPADPRLKPSNPFDSISSNASAILGSLATLAGVKNIMTKTDLNEQEPVSKPLGFYLDHEEKETEVRSSDKSAAIGISLASVKGKEGGEKALITDVNTNKQTVVAVASTNPSDEGNKDITAINVESQPQLVETSGLNEDEPPANKEIDNVKDSVNDKQKETTDIEGANLVSQIQAEVQGPKVNKPEVPNVAALLKGLGSSPASASAQGLVGQKLLQLPTALMSLFSKLPNQSSAADTETPPVVAESKTQAPAETPSEPQDVDLRGQSSGKPTPAGFKSTFIEVGKKSDTTETKNTNSDKTDKEKPSKSFMGFDYDSASDSDGSFEGFEDDGTRVLSARKRKPVDKGKVLNQPSSQIGMTNEMGDIDVRNTVVEDVDLRNQAEPEIADKDMRREPPTLDTDHRLVSVNLDIDQRLGSAPPPHSDPYPRLPTTEVIGTPPPTMVLDVDHRRHPFPPPPGLGLQFMPPGGQPPPPGEEWNISQSVPPPLPPGMGQLPPPLMTQPPSINPPLPPLPSEPPAPKPPEPPMKKDKRTKEMEMEHSDKDSNGFGKKTPMLQSDARLQKIVLELAKKEPIDPPPIPPTGLRSRMHHGQRRFSRPPLPMSTQGMMPHRPPPIQNPRMPWTEAMIGSTGWMPGPPPPGTMLDAQSQMMPPQLPPNMQPGVCFPPNPPAPSQLNPPSLLGLPVGGHSTSLAKTAVTETSGMPAEIETGKELHPPHSQESEEGGSQSRHSRNDSRNRDHDDRDDRRRRDRERDHDRDRDRDHDRDRDRERRSRSGDSSDRKSHDHSRGHSHDRDRSRSERDRDRNRDRDRDRDRDRRSDRDYDRDRRYSKHRH